MYAIPDFVGSLLCQLHHPDIEHVWYWWCNALLLLLLHHGVSVSVSAQIVEVDECFRDRDDQSPLTWFAIVAIVENVQSGLDRTRLGSAAENAEIPFGITRRCVQ